MEHLNPYEWWKLHRAGYSPPPPVINLANPPGYSLCRDNFSDCLEGKVIHLQKGMWRWCIYVWKRNKGSTGLSIFKGENPKTFHTTTYRPGQCLPGKIHIVPFSVSKTAMWNSIIYFKIPKRIVSSCRRKVPGVQETANANQKGGEKDEEAHYRILSIRGCYSKLFIKFFLSFLIASSRLWLVL